MAALLWLLIPLVAAVGAGLWGSWAARNRRTGDVTELNGYARFREAMERTHTGTETDPLAPAAGSMPGVESRTDAPAVH
ncbi:hypothetical protein ACFVDQ_05910 [Streptomyces sp. NPDC057684]|uniref:hypothetical protein n=1 Tax=unclassified Streptomyces TaxID=2593676 RepID=UPI0036778EE2